MNDNTCPNCGAIILENDDFCIECGTHRRSATENYCCNVNCERFKKILSNPTQYYCGKCGKPTLYGSQIEQLI